MKSWHFQEETETVSPQLVVDRRTLIDNIDQAISMAHGAGHLWPHVKTHKTGQIVRLMTEKGIHRFKCATIAEAEMSASFGGKHIILAYPLIGPNISRFLRLMKAFPDVTFYAIEDNEQAFALLSEAAQRAGQTIHALIDVNMGMNRTGVALNRLKELYEKAAALPALKLCGLHCYDGHRTEQDFSSRRLAAQPAYDQVTAIRAQLQEEHLSCELMVMGGTPSFPCYAEKNDPALYFSPGTIFLNDYGYTKKFPDLPFDMAAAVMTRVVSLPGPGKFTLDLGYKGIAADPDGLRGLLADIPNAHPLFQSEEHWAFAMDEGHEDECPQLGDILYVVPTHICPTSALYSHILAIEDGHLTAKWEVTARNRQITY